MKNNVTTQPRIGELGYSAPDPSVMICNTELRFAGLGREMFLGQVSAEQLAALIFSLLKTLPSSA